MSKFKATTPDGKTVFGNLIRWELLSCWMVHENGETLINPDTIEKLSEMSKFKATTPDGKTVFGNLIRWELLSCWMVHENGETLINPDTIEKLSDGE